MLVGMLWLLWLLFLAVFDCFWLFLVCLRCCWLFVTVLNVVMTKKLMSTTCQGMHPMSVKPIVHGAKLPGSLTPSDLGTSSDCV